MPTTRRTTIEPVRNAAGQCVGYYTHTDTLTPIRMVKGKPVDPPPRPAPRTQQQLRTTAKPTRTPARQATPAPQTVRVCRHCFNLHTACTCPVGNSFSQIVELQRNRGLRPGEPTTPAAAPQEHRALHAAQGQQGGAPDASDLFARIIDRQRQAGLR